MSPLIADADLPPDFAAARTWAEPLASLPARRHSTAMVAGLEPLKSWARALKREIAALWIAASDRRTPWLAKLVAGAVAAYALSPVDLIPDFIPVLGYLDDLLILPLGIALAVKLIPPPLMAEFRARAAAQSGRPRSYLAAALIILAWLAAGAALVFWLWGRAPVPRPGDLLSAF